MTENIKTITHVRIHTTINEFLIASNGYSIFKSENLGKTWLFLGTLPVSKQKKVLSKSRLISRALRIGIHQIKEIHNHKILICSDNDFFLSDVSFSKFKRITIDSHFYQLLDHSICVTPNYTYFGEYMPNVKRNEINIFRTDDGENWDKIYSFPKKSIKHIHLLQFDPFSQKIWFSTGDADSECLLGNSNLDFSEIEIVGRNHQDWRSLELLFTSEEIFWGTDNPNGQNWLISFDRKSHIIKKLVQFSGPIYNLKQFSNTYMMITATEGSKGEWDNKAHIWVSPNLKKGPWKDYKSFKKDCMPYIFGFGRLIFGTNLNHMIYLNGSALKNIDNHTIVLALEKINEEVH